MKTHYVAWFPLAMVLAMSCSQSAENPIACAQDGTCPSGLVCKANQCIKTECAKDADCTGQACVNGVCTGECTPGQTQCAGNALQTCDANGTWPMGVECTNQTCIGNGGMAECKAGTEQCKDLTTQKVCNMSGNWETKTNCAANSQTCVNTTCQGSCAAGQVQCTGNSQQTCDQTGTWSPLMSCPKQTCVQNMGCSGVCAPGDLNCAQNTTQTCGPDGQWVNGQVCTGQVCMNGQCMGLCQPGAKQCDANGKPQTCNAMGVWVTGADCVNQTCVAGVCSGVCAPGQMQCTLDVPQTCNTMGLWQDGAKCPAVCSAGACSVPKSCAGLSAFCGPQSNESCCASRVVPSGTYNRSNDPTSPATVSSFGLDRFEVTVGRFRQFVNAYPGSKPAGGAGAHPLIANSGWDLTWNTNLPADQATLRTTISCAGFPTWTDTPGANEYKPMNCLSWFDAFAFCAWDGGRLPTEAEWNYAAAGGNEQRVYPWSNPPSSTVIDTTFAIYALGSIFDVGQRSANGDGKWGHADLAGNSWEFTLDWFAPYATTCTDCAHLAQATDRVIRGGGWADVAPGNLYTSFRSSSTPTHRDSSIGIRCARNP